MTITRTMVGALATVQALTPVLVSSLVLSVGLLACGGEDEPLPDEPTGAWTPTRPAAPKATPAVDNAVTIDAPAYLARYAGEGALSWARPVGAGWSNVYVASMATLRDGSAVVLGTHHGVSPYLTDRPHLFIARFDPAGELRGAQSHPISISPREGVGEGDIVVTPDGGMIVVGSFSGVGRLVLDDRLAPPIELAAEGVSDGFIAKLDARGSAIWAQRLGGEGPDGLTAVTVAPDGTVIAVGHRAPAAPWVDERTGADAGGMGVAIAAAFAPSGELLWERAVGGECAGHAQDVAARADGSFVVLGTVSDVVCLSNADDGVELAPASEVGFLASFDAEGELTWSRHLRARYPSPWGIGWTVHRASSVALGAADAIYAVGDGTVCQVLRPMMPCNWMLDAAFVVKLEAVAGAAPNAPEIAWHRAVTGGHPTLQRVAVLPDGGVWVTGEFEGQAIFGAEVGALMSAGGWDGFLARYRPDGELTFARTVAAGRSWSDTQGVQAFADGSAIVLGNLGGPAEFAPAHLTPLRSFVEVR